MRLTKHRDLVDRPRSCRGHANQEHGDVFGDCCFANMSAEQCHPAGCWLHSDSQPRPVLTSMRRGADKAGRDGLYRRPDLGADPDLCAREDRAPARRNPERMSGRPPKSARPVQSPPGRRAAAVQQARYPWPRPGGCRRSRRSRRCRPRQVPDDAGRHGGGVRQGSPAPPLPKRDPEPSVVTCRASQKCPKCRDSSRVGDPGLEPGTSSLSEKRSNRLS